MTELYDVLSELSAEDAYSRGAIDVLALLGLVTKKKDRAEASGAVAAMALDALKAHLADGVCAGLDWEDLDGEAPRGVDILRVFEAARAARVAKPTPARVVEAAQSVIKRRVDGQDMYLMQFDAHAGRYQPIGGKREAYETSAEQALRREIAEELVLADIPGPEQLTLVPIGGGWHETALSATYGILTQYTFAFFHAAEIRFAFGIDADTHWVSRAEIDAERASDGRAISPIYALGLGLDVLDGLEETVNSHR